jgi:arylsulfatase A-like enzyme
MTRADTSPESTSGQRPNVLIINCHDLGRHLGCYGRGVETPRVDALAAEGARFSRPFASAPQCSPSRGSLLTGLYPHNNGLMGLASRGNWSFDEGVTPLPALLGEAGYETHLIGVQHAAADAGPWVGVSGRPERLGYQHVHSYNEDVSLALDVADRFEECVGDMAEGAPFFASLGFSEPHRPFRREEVPDEAYERYSPETVDPLPYLPDRPGIREEIADLQGLISATVDPAVGRITEALDEQGIAEETIVVFTADHGLAMPRAKATCFDPGIEIPLIVRYPGEVPAGVTHDDLLSNVDVVPTLCEFAGVEPPENLDGRTFAPLLQGDGDAYEPRDHVFAEMTFHGFYDPMRAIRTEEYKYVRSFWDVPEVNIPAFDSKSAREVRGELCSDSRPMELLYHLPSDPHEQESLASDRLIYEPAEYGSEPDPDHADALEELRGRVTAWMEETDDPLLDGVVTPPFPGLDI